MNHKKQAATMIKHDLRNTVFVMLPAFDHLIPVHFDNNSRMLNVRPSTIRNYRNIKAHWNACYFVLTENPVNGVQSLEFKDHIYENGTLSEVGECVYNDLEAWLDKINVKQRSNVGFAITLRKQKITLEDVERWSENDPDFRQGAIITTRKDEARQIELLERVL